MRKKHYINPELKTTWCGRPLKGRHIRSGMKSLKYVNCKHCLNQVTGDKPDKYWNKYPEYKELYES